MRPRRFCRRPARRAGTRAVQRLLECLHGDEAEAQVAAALAPRIDELILDLHANHVVQRCVATLGGGRNAFVIEAVSRSFVEVATHRHGCCVLQRCLDSASGAAKARLVDAVVEHTRALITDQFGNYVVQYVLQAGDAEMTRRVVRAICGCVPELACEKFSSNVVEKCLTAGVRAARAPCTMHPALRLPRRAGLPAWLRMAAERRELASCWETGAAVHATCHAPHPACPRPRARAPASPPLRTTSRARS